MFFHEIVFYADYHKTLKDETVEGEKGNLVLQLKDFVTAKLPQSYCHLHDELNGCSRCFALF
jgi:hypothetical protein